jgi:Trk K+ transport system NAD-binding subunit
MDGIRQSGHNTSEFTTSFTQDEVLSQIHDHIIICGLHNLGFRIVEQLHGANLGVVVIDDQPQERFVEFLEEWKVVLLRQDSRSKNGLLKAGVRRAKALIVLEDDDLRKLETILQASELAPGVQIVSSFSNSQISQRLVAKLTNVSILDLPELVSPTFITASLSRKVLHLFEFSKKDGNEELAVIIDRPTNRARLDQLYGQLIPLQIEWGAKTGEIDRVEICPPGEREVGPEDTIFVIGLVHSLLDLDEVELKQENLDRVRFGGTTARKQRRARPFRHFVRSRRVLRVFRDLLEPRFRWTLAIFLVLLLLSAVVLLLKADSQSNPADAFYFGLNILIGQPVFSLNDFWGYKVYGFFAGLVGIAILATVNAFITNYIVSVRLAQVLGQQKAIEMNDHVILSGLDAIGYKVLASLVERREQVVVLEKDESNPYNDLAQKLNVPVLYGDASNPAVLERANVSKARCIIILNDDDRLNLETALHAREKKPEIRVILRLFDRTLAEQIENLFDIHTARSTSALAAPYFVARALNYRVITTFYAHQTPFIVTSLDIKAEGQLNGLTLKQLSEETGIRVLAHRDAPKLIEQGAVPLPSWEDIFQALPAFYPAPFTTLAPGDTLYFVGPTERILEVYKRNDLSGINTTQAGS